MKKGMLVLVLILLCVSVIANPVKIAAVDTQRIAKEYIKAVEAKKKLDDFERVYKEELQGYYDDMQAKYESLQLNESVWTEDQKRRAGMEISGLQERFETRRKEIDELYAKKESELMNPVLKEAQEVVTAIAKREKYTIVLDSITYVLIYVDETIDITDMVLKELNSRP